MWAAPLLLLLASQPAAVLACSAAAPCRPGTTWDGTPASTVQPDWAGTGLAAYVARPPVTTAVADFAVVQVTDIFGVPLKNARLYADELAAATGARAVVVPDFFYKPGFGPFDEAGNTDPAKFAAWLAAYPSAQVLADAEKVVAAAKKQFNVTRVSAIGFCWGGRIAALLAGGNATAPPAVDAAVLLHPSQLTLADVEAIGAPTLFLVNGQDRNLPDGLRAQIESVLKTSKPTSALHFYPDARHGHTLRADVSPDSADAFRRTVAWLREH